MATVYLARAVAEGGFERLAALKVLHPHLLGEQEFLGMFLDEARVAARIHHPNVVAIQDLGVEENRMFTVMDYVLGDTLAAAQQAAIKLRRGLPLGIVLRVALDVLRGLDAAHELVDVNGRSLNVVHRDATPHNILLGVDGVSRVTDFGIAKAESRISFTGVGTLKGKAPYMAPEQFANRRVDRRVDVFSMAITIWEALALRRCLPPDLAQPTRRPAYRPLATILRDVPPAGAPPESSPTPSSDSSATTSRTPRPWRPSCGPSRPRRSPGSARPFARPSGAPSPRPGPSPRSAESQAFRPRTPGPRWSRAPPTSARRR
jgi:serine/threonine protein kinase